MMVNVSLLVGECGIKTDDVCITLAFHNHGEKDLYFSSDSLFLDGITADHKFKIFGEPPVECQFLSALYEPHRVLLQANTTVTSKVNLAVFCDFSQGGVHTIEFNTVAHFCETDYKECTSSVWFSDEVDIEFPGSIYHIDSLYRDLNPDDYELLSRDYSVLDNYGLFTINEDWNNSNLPDVHVNMDYKRLHRIMTYDRVCCNKEDVIYMGEFFRYTCPANVYYQNLSDLPKRFTNRIICRASVHHVIDAALKFGGCLNKARKVDRALLFGDVFHKENYFEHENGFVPLIIFLGAPLLWGCGLYMLIRSFKKIVCR